MGSIPTARVSKVANVVKWLTHQIVALTFGGSIPLVPIIWSVGQGVKTPPFHGGNTGSNPVRTILEDYPSSAEGNGLENRQACKSVRGFESHILLIINAGWSS